MESHWLKQLYSSMIRESDVPPQDRVDLFKKEYQGDIDKFATIQKAYFPKVRDALKRVDLNKNTIDTALLNEYLGKWGFDLDDKYGHKFYDFINDSKMVYNKENINQFYELMKREADSNGTLDLLTHVKSCFGGNPDFERMRGLIIPKLIDDGGSAIGPGEVFLSVLMGGKKPANKSSDEGEGEIYDSSKGSGDIDVKGKIFEVKVREAVIDAGKKGNPVDYIYKAIQGDVKDFKRFLVSFVFDDQNNSVAREFVDSSDFDNIILPFRTEVQDMYQKKVETGCKLNWRGLANIVDVIMSMNFKGYYLKKKWDYILYLEERPDSFKISFLNVTDDTPLIKIYKKVENFMGENDKEAFDEYQARLRKTVCQINTTDSSERQSANKLGKKPGKWFTQKRKQDR